MRHTFKKQRGFSVFTYLTGVITVLLLLITVPTQAITSDVPLMEQGIQIGDVTSGHAIIWSRADRPARLIVQYADNTEFLDAVTLRGSYALEDSDFTVRQDFTGRQRYLRESLVRNLTNEHNTSKPIVGHFHTLGEHDDVRFVWGGDTAGQGWGINPNLGGMKIYEAMRKTKPHFFIQSGDNIYSDGPIPESQPAGNGQTWVNLTTPETSKVKPWTNSEAVTNITCWIKISPL